MSEFKYGNQSQDLIVHNTYKSSYFTEITKEGYFIEYKIEHQQNAPNHSWIDFRSLNIDSLPLYIQRLILAHSNLFGESFLFNLPKKIAGENIDKYWNFTFNTDAKGYVEKCKITDYFRTVTTYTYKWE